MIVFASNESILERLNGLCERTFQRHVSQLIEAGLLRRNDSSNRKRFKLRGPTNKALAFGFDLSPLIEKAPEISAFALEESKRASHAAMLRQQILSLLAASDHLSIDPAKDAQLRQVLRRKLPIDMLEHMLSTLEVAADARSRCNGTITANSEEADKMSANDQQNVGHIHKSKEEDIEIDRTELKIRAKNLSSAENLLRKLRTACPTAGTWLQSGLSTWNDVLAQVHQIASWIGISSIVYNRAETRQGRENTAATLLAILERAEKIRQPAAYFHAITLGKRSESFNVDRMLNQLMVAT